MNQFNTRNPERTIEIRPDSNNKGGWLLVGALGSGMRALAELLIDAGEVVTGTDHQLVADDFVHQTAFDHDRLRLFRPDDVEQIFAQSPTRVAYSMAVPEQSQFLEAFRSLGKSVQSLPQALNQILGSRDQLCIAGTHGKTTTSGMVYSILEHAACHPSAYIGGMKTSTGRSGVLGSGTVAVVESCEYRKSFLHLTPATVVLTGIESDHFDYFKSEVECDQTFIDFVHRLPSDGKLIYNADCPRAAAVAAISGRPTISVSLTKDSEWNAIPYISSASKASSGGQGQEFLLRNRTQEIGVVRIGLPGSHNRFNAVAAIAASVANGVAVETAIQGIASFSGIHRRFEHRGHFGGIDWIDDYAHHPTAIRSTLKTVHETFPGRRVIAICEPHQLSRLTAMFSDFRSALSLADECLILPVLPARESASSAECTRLSGRLVRSISDSGGRAFLMANLDQVIGRLDHSGRPGDVVITMGAGRTHQIHDEIHRRLQRNSAA